MRPRAFTLLPTLLLGLTLLAPAAARAEAGDPGDFGDKAGDKAGDKTKTVDKRAATPRVIVVEDDEAAPGGEKTERRVYRFDSKKVARGYLGIGLTDLTPELRAHFGVPEASGVMVSKVEPGSPAEKAGLQPKDRIRRIDAQKSGGKMAERIQTWWMEPSGTHVAMEIERNKQRQTVELVLLPRSAWAQGDAAPPASK